MPMIDDEPAPSSSTVLPCDAIGRLARIDLNLLVVFAMLMQERSVTGAAKRLFLGQSAVSASLKRLRDLLGDPLLVKVGRRMEPSERALRLKPQVESLLARIEAITLHPPSFDPALDESTVTLGLSDDFEIIFLPAIVQALRRQAPSMRLVARPVSHTTIREALDRGEIDLGLSVFGELDAWHGDRPLFDQHDGCLFDGDLVATGERALTLDEYLASEQIIVTFDGALGGKIDRVLGTNGLRRTVRFGTSRFSSLPYLVKGTAFVASMPELIGRVLARMHGLRFCPLPFDVPPARPRMAWHKRNDLDPAARWLRSLVANIVSAKVDEITPPMRTQGLVGVTGSGRSPGDGHPAIPPRPLEDARLRLGGPARRR